MDRTGSRSLDRIQRRGKDHLVFTVYFSLHHLIPVGLKMGGEPLWSLHGFASQERADLFKKN